MIILGGAKRQSRAVFAAVAGRYSSTADRESQIFQNWEQNFSFFFLSDTKTMGYKTLFNFESNSV